MMKTNFQMIVELDNNFTPKKRHIVSAEEMNIISEALCLNEMDALALQNLRDFTVMYFDMKMGDNFDMDTHDKMSAIVGVIDNRALELRFER